MSFDEESFDQSSPEEKASPEDVSYKEEVSSEQIFIFEHVCTFCKRMFIFEHVCTFLYIIETELCL